MLLLTVLMNSVYFATSNQEKALIAQTVCSKLDISVKQIPIEVDEIQGEDPLIIVQDKAHKAYKKFLSLL